MNYICINCGNPTNSTCRKCTTRYCSRECQVAHWPIHKTMCREIGARINEVMRKIMGNLYLLYNEYKSPIVVSIDDTTADFCTSDKMRSITLSVKNDGDPNTITFLFVDNSIKRDIEWPTINVKKKYSCPGVSWTLII